MVGEFSRFQSVKSMPHEELTTLRRLRSLLIRAWDSDGGNGTMRPELWHFFLSALEVELCLREGLNSDVLANIREAARRVQANQFQKYKKSVWRDLDDALYQIFGPGSGW
jgi:hypothetical protein